MEKAQSTSPYSEETIGLFFGLIGVLIFSGTLPATRVAVAFFDPWFLTFGRAGMASAAAAFTLVILKRNFPRKHIWTLLIIGLFLVFGFPGAMGLAMLTVPSAHGGVVLGILPLATAIFASLLAGERLSLLFWLCGISGAIVIIAFALRDGAWGFEVGDAWLAVGCVCAAAGYVMSGKLTRFMAGWEVICWALIITAPLSIVGSFLFWDNAYTAPPMPQATAFLYVGLGSMFLGFFAWNKGLQMGGMSRVGQLQLLQTFFTLAVAAVVLGESVTFETVLFATAVVAIVLLGRKAKVTR
ncbi:DMT family transporter [Pseudahrensia aquimaris]|uniref:DMT family transporter n=1 Tax=Pseudahrensia aquimaris TaxID=744461 RepID=A0ABW3FFC5_9HYPH